MIWFDHLFKLYSLIMIHIGFTLNQDYKIYFDFASQ